LTSAGDEGGAVALAGLAVEGELGDDEDLAVRAQRLVHLAVGVLEDPQRGDLVGQPVAVGLGVVVGHAQEHQQARADRGHDLAVDRHRRGGDPLDKGAHARS
jgi:hypothetical protein